ncbi:MAG: CotH kinase family protein [Oscillospiraceae bacterium]|nr:CotH kinase family protein [Oscillospiraceae bacterium]
MKKKWIVMLPVLLLLLAVLFAVLRQRLPVLLSEMEELREHTAVSSEEPEKTPQTVPQPIPEAPARLSELMASNKAALKDADGDFPDWIELVNDGEEERSLEGFWLSDEKKNPQKWQFPAVVLQPGERLIVFCSGKDRREGELHTNFSLNSDGETLLLSSPEGQELWRRSYSDCGADQSVIWEEEGAVLCDFPTPGYPNNEAGREAFLAANDTHGALVINEAVLSNDWYALQHNMFYDWAELKNVSDRTLRLSDYYLSDDADDRFQFHLPDLELAAGGTFIVFCSGDGTLNNQFYCHAPFALSAKGETLFLSQADGVLSDAVYLHDLPYRGSCGRMDGEAGFFYFKTPSPEKNNTEGYRSIAAEPAAYPAEGVYEGVGDLSVELNGEGTIYYTTDGSIPTADSKRYTGPLTLTGTTVLRAVCIEEGKVVSDHATFSYILNEGHQLPVVSLVTEPNALFGPYGIYTNWASDDTRDAHVSFFEDGGGFAADCAIKLHGASSRELWQKKNYKLIFKDRYGGDLSYDLFHNGITEFHSIVLRGGDTEGMHMLRDELGSLVANKVTEEPLALDSRYCALYINGSYFGAYALREAYSEKYVADHLGGTEDSVTILRAPIKTGEALNIINQLIYRDMSQPENYEWACSVLDMDSLCEWMALEAYFNNLDPSGNLRYVSSDATDGRWRIAFFDLDIAMTNDNAYWGDLFNREYQIGKVTSNLLNSPAFKETLLRSAARLYQNGLSSDLVLQTMDELLDELGDEAQRDLRRWRESADQYRLNLDRQRSRLGEQRTATWLLELQQWTGVSDATMREYFGDYPKSW